MNTLIERSLESQITDLICVSRPYYALRNLQALTDTLFQCEIKVENLNYSELSPISPAESGRHLAILGSCVLAYNNPVPVKHYYLACAAELVRGTENVSFLFEEQPEYLVCRAELDYLDHKTGRVLTTVATPDGRIIFELVVSYKVMKAELFCKLFKSKQLDAATVTTTNPYTKAMKLYNMQRLGNSLTADMGAIRPEQCAGHFDQYPALPVAILSGALVQLADAHLKQVCNNSKVHYITRCANLRANQLAFAGEEVFLESVLVEEGTNAFTFRVAAVNGAGAGIGDIVITFELAG